MGTGAKVLIILGVVAGLGLLVCCGGGGLFLWNAKPTVTELPAEVVAKTRTVIPIEIDEEQWEPVFHMEMSVPFLMDLSMANWKSKLDEGGIMLTRVLLKVKDGGDASQEQIDQQMEQAFSQGGGKGQKGQLAQLNSSTSEPRQVTIFGQEAELTYIEGKRLGSEDEWRELKGSVKDGDEIVVIRIQAKAENFDEKKIIEMLEAVK